MYSLYASIYAPQCTIYALDVIFFLHGNYLQPFASVIGDFG